MNNDEVSRIIGLGHTCCLLLIDFDTITHSSHNRSSTAVTLFTNTSSSANGDPINPTIPDSVQLFSDQEFDSINHLMSNCVNKTETLDTATCKAVMRDILNSYFPASKIPIIILYLLLFLIGVTGNVLVILCVLLHRHMRSATNVFLLNLALSDLLIFITCEPWVVGSYIYNSWIYGAFICKFHAVLQGTSLGLSIYTLASISVERYIMIARPLKSRIGSVIRKDRMAVWIILIWIGSFAACLPLYFAYESVPMGFTVGGEHVVEVCVETWTNRPYGKRIFTIFMFLALYLAPLIFMTVLLSRISKHLLSHFNQESGHQSDAQRCNRGAISVRRKRRRICLLLLILLILFAVCWLPYHAINLFVDFFRVDHKHRPTEVLGWVVDFLYPTAQILAFANSAINPICTLVVSEKFRGALSLLRECACCKSREMLRETRNRSQRNNSRQQMELLDQLRSSDNQI